MNQGFHGYSEFKGYKFVRESVKNHILKRDNNLGSVDSEDIYLTNGGS